MSAERRQLPYALLLSLLIHALLLSLTFGGQGWLPGFGFFWQDRRIEATDLSVVLVPAQITAAEPGARSSVNGPMQASIGQPVAGESAPTPSYSGADSGPKGRSDRAQGQADATSQAEAATQASARHRDRCVSCQYAVAHGRLRGRRDHTGTGAGNDRRGAVRWGRIGRAGRAIGTSARDRRGAKRAEPGDSDATASRCRRCSAGANRSGSVGGSRRIGKTRSFQAGGTTAGGAIGGGAAGRRKGRGCARRGGKD